MTEIIYVINPAWYKYFIISLHTLLASGTDFNAIRVFCVGGKLDKFRPKDKRIFLEEVPSLAVDDFFLINKVYSCKSLADRIVFLDADTLIFRPLHDIWADSKADFIGRHESFYEKEEFNQQYWKKILNSINAKSTTPYFNSGFFVFQNNAHKRIGKIWEEFIHKGLNRELFHPEKIHWPLGKRYTEQISFSLAIGALDLSYKIMDQREHIYGWNEEFEDVEIEDIAVLHTGGRQFYDYLCKVRKQINLPLREKFKIWYINYRNLIPRSIKNKLKEFLTKDQIEMVKTLRKVLLRVFCHKRYKPNNQIALDITPKCNMRCFNCESSSKQAPSSEYMSIKQAKKFVNSAISLKYRWDRLDLRGGEPTLHPHFFEFLDVIKKYKDFNSSCDITLTTNGAGKRVQDILKKIPKWVRIDHGNIDGPKEEGKYIYDFHTFNEAPKDLFYYKFADFTKGCWIRQYCFGLALSRHGYYPCSPGASIDRIFGFDIGIKKLSLVNEMALRNQMKILCRCCGHFKEPADVTNEEKISPSWRKAYEQYKKQKPTLSLYGNYQ